MNTLHAVVIGAGSIGSRHARNLSALGIDVVVIDPDAARAASVPGCRAAAFDLGVAAAADLVVIASPTVNHAEHLLRILEGSAARILVEKPLCLPDEDYRALVAAGRDRVMVGFNLRLHDPVSRAVRMVHDGAVGEPLAYRLWFGSWLPDWRPDVDYRTTYSARADLGGGVLLDAIHELDLALWVTRDSLLVDGALMGRLGPLEIDVEDTVRAHLRTGSGLPVDVALDYLSRRYRRGLEVIGDEATLRLDWADRTLEIEDARRIVEQKVDWSLDESYRLEARRLVAFASDGTPPPVDAAAGAESVALAGSIRDAALTGVTP